MKYNVATKWEQRS
uniref:Uncharacterized protein n=1 Tax=Arundo donax TaxID=35708 RepID=A0A0A9AT09_ARUDO